MQRLTLCRWCVLVLACVALACAVNAQTTITRNLSDFLNAQGAFLPGYPGPVKAFLGSGDPSNGRMISVDYANLVNQCWPTLNLPTTVDGAIHERQLPDGRSEVTVIMHTQNALTWVADGDFATGKILFGQRWNTSGTCSLTDSTSSGLDHPVLGDYFLHVVFINTTFGAPLPDLEQILFAPEPGQQVLTFKNSASAVGPLYNLPGVPDGTIGRASTEQIGLLYKTNGKPAIDGYTVERVELQPIGK